MQPAAPETAVEFDESECITRAQKGDREAFTTLMNRHRSSVINVVYRMCADARLAEDASQEAFIRAWQHLPGYRPRSTFRSWLYRIAINAALDVLRRERPSADIETQGLASSTEPVEAGLVKQEKIQRVRQAILSLSEASRSVLVLREYEELSYQEISAALDIPIGTVMSRLNYARKCLLERLTPTMEEL